MKTPNHSKLFRRNSPGRLMLLGAFLTALATSSFAGQGPQPSICTRACWGARAPQCGISQMAALNRAIIHHTAGSSDWTTDYATGQSRVRAIQNLHMDSQGWCDIGYHFLVNAGGHIYEGRSGSMSSLPRGTHDCANNNSFGFNLMGYFHPPYNQTPTAAGRSALYDVIAWRMPSAWSPYGGGSYSGCEGTYTVGTLDGHRAIVATACPGDGFYNPYITANYNGGEARNEVNNRKNAGATINPPYYFDANAQGWSPGNSMSALTWTACCGWPGIIYGDQTGNDAFLVSPNTSYFGPFEGLLNISFFPQNGGVNHDMKAYYATAAESFFDETKSSPMVWYNAQNAYVRVNLYMHGPKYSGQSIKRLRLDFDGINSGTRWIVNHVVSQSSLKWHFPSDTMYWYAAYGVSAVQWTGPQWGWPGSIYFDQVGNDGHIVSNVQFFDGAGPNKYLGAANDKIKVRVYPQGGSSSSHDMRIYFRTTSEPSWSDAKSVGLNYTAANQWVELTFDVGANPSWSGAYAGSIQELRLDVDQISKGTRWIIDSVTIEH